jgi:RNA polymerase sigma-70 factor (ECF subfamily)
LQEDLLLERAQQFDPKALAEIFDAYYERIHSYIYRRTGSPSMSEDMAGEVFLRLLEAIKTGRGPRTNLLAWLYRVAHNLIVDHYRRQSKAKTQSLEDWLVSVPDTMSDGVDRELTKEQLRQAISRLTGDQQQVIVLKFVEGLSNAQVGIILGKPEGAIKSLQHRALAALRRQIEEGQLNVHASALRSAVE